jgi:hypothetical protein
MSTRCLVSAALIAILSVSSDGLAQEVMDVPDAQVESVPSEPQTESHVLTEESAEAVEAPADAPAAAIDPREQSIRAQRGVRRGNPRGEASRVRPETPRRAPAPRPAARDRERDAGRTIVIAPRVYVPYPHRYRYAGPYIPTRSLSTMSYVYYGPYLGGAYDPYAYPERYADSLAAYGIGQLRLQVMPRHARVFVDGDYAGTVDDFDGMFQSLKLESGSYAIRLEAPGYETIGFDVRITPTQKVTYRETLRPE